jgi:hypothetical protein
LYLYIKEKFRLFAVVIRDLPYLKLLHPVALQLHMRGIPYILYYWDVNRGEKEYNRASYTNIQKSSPDIIKSASKVVSFTTDEQLYSYLNRDNAYGMISVEIGMWIKWKKLPKSVKTFSIQYLTDSLWSNTVTGLTKAYYTTEFLMRKHHEFHSLKIDSNRDRFVGSPLFDPLSKVSGDNILVLLPNLRKEHVNMSFGNAKNFIRIIEKFAQEGELILKTRQKQWMPKEILGMAKEVASDDKTMYPSKISELFTRCNTVVNFYSSGIFESVYANNYVVNVPIPLKRWDNWDQNKLRSYFESPLYNFIGVVENVEQKSLLDGTWKLSDRPLNCEDRNKWIKKYIGLCPDCPNNGAKNIVDDILRSYPERRRPLPLGRGAKP